MDDEIEARGIGDPLKLGLFVFAVGVLPVWAIVTAMVAHLHPELQQAAVLLPDGTTAYVTPSLVQRAIHAGSISAGWMGALVLAVLPVAWLVGGLWQRRGAATSGGAGELLDDLLVADAPLRVRVRRDGREAAGAPAVAPADAPAEPVGLPAEPASDPPAAAPVAERSAVAPPADDEGAEPPRADDELDELFR